ncbi:MAG TPA: sulfotransferase [Rhizomicrobium sp.]|nr:sulfotransferase [Rhizomicrobium sp.]
MILKSAPEISRTRLPDWEYASALPPAGTYEQALTLAAMGCHEEATAALGEVTARASGHAPAWQKLAELLHLAGKDREANEAALRAADNLPAWPAAVDAREPVEIDSAERALRERLRSMAALPEQMEALREHLRRDPTDAAALRLLGIGAWRDGDLMRARALFERALVLAPCYEGARADLTKLLQTLGEDAAAVVEARRLLVEAPQNLTYRALYADILCRLNDFDSAIPLIEQLIREEPTRTRFRCVYGQVLRYAGRQEDSARALRAALASEPGFGEAYWDLAELRGNYLTDDDVAAIRAHLCDGSQSISSRMRLQYALGRALETRGDFAASFAAYQAGAELAREIAAGSGDTYDPALEVEQLRRRRAVFTAPLFARTASAGNPDCTPIFVLGMPRSGSTLVEQILASHSLVEATTELPVLDVIARELSLSRLMVVPDAYPECVTDLNPSELANLGARYLEQAEFYRKAKLPCFVDKRPWNWINAGLIRLILPHAKIIDIRREPMAACFAMYKQILPEYAAFATDLHDLAHYYTQYVGMMGHYESAMPGHIHFLSYERLIEDTETEIRRLLEYCGLPFEERCLRFWETDRTIGTPSAEQVRRPIFRHALQQWRNYEPWLEPLKKALTEFDPQAAAAPQPREYDLALTLDAMGMREGALEELRAVARRLPVHFGSWKKLAELLPLAADDKGAARANDAAARLAGQASKWRPTRDMRTLPQLEDGERKLQERCSGLSRASQMDILRDHLQDDPADAAAACMLARLERHDGDLAIAQTLLERTLELSPFYYAARAELVSLLLETKYFARALEQIKILRRWLPGKLEYRAMHSDALSGLGDFAGALAITEGLLREEPRHPYHWYANGMVLQALGRADESARAFRTCLELSPTTGRVWWALADMKTGCLTETDVAAMRASLADASLPPSSRMYIHYALGHALELAGDYSASFAAYQQGARLFRGFFLKRGQSYDEDAHIEHLRRVKAVFTARTLAARSLPSRVSSAVTPIFIVGLPRAGSTLVEQILASHSLVEATRELPAMSHMTHDLEKSRILVTPSAYPDCVRDMGPAQLAALGERYLEESRPYRKTDRSYFTDKSPWNWMEAGLIRLILPHAKIIDVRREPMAACFANFKQVFTEGADFSNDLHDVGRYYVEYAALMEHWRSAMPGYIHFMAYERLVDDTENEIRRMLNFCGLPFEEDCLRFWQSKRAVATPSAGQVRRPIYRQALEQWRNFEPWLGPLKAALAEPSRV